MLTAAECVTDIQVISADSHVEEPIDEFIAQLSEHLRPQARRLVKHNGVEMIEVPGLAPISVDYAERRLGGDGTDRRPYDLLEFRTDETGGRDLVQRVAKIEGDGVWGEVIFPNRNLALGAHPNPEYQREMARIHNRWLMDIFLSSSDSHRFAPAAVVPCSVPGDAAAEVFHAKDQGFRCVMLPPVVPWLPYWHSDWNVLWNALEETGLPVNFHVFSGNTSQGADVCNPWVLSDEQIAAGRRIARGERLEEKIGTSNMAMMGAMSVLNHLIGSGILEDHPDLRFALTECEAGWIPWALQELDLMQQRRSLGMVKLSMRPSEYFHRQGWATFIEDKVAVDLLDYIGEDRLMWTNDYPHDEGTYLESVETIDRLLGHLPQRTRRKLLHDNAAALYGFTNKATEIAS